MTVSSIKVLKIFLHGVRKVHCLLLLSFSFGSSPFECHPHHHLGDRRLLPPLWLPPTQQRRVMGGECRPRSLQRVLRRDVFLGENNDIKTTFKTFLIVK